MHSGKGTLKSSLPKVDQGVHAVESIRTEEEEGQGALGEIDLAELVPDLDVRGPDDSHGV